MDRVLIRFHLSHKSPSRSLAVKSWFGIVTIWGPGEYMMLYMYSGASQRVPKITHLFRQASQLRIARTRYADGRRRAAHSIAHLPGARGGGASRTLRDKNNYRTRPCPRVPARLPGRATPTRTGLPHGQSMD
eukprot:4711683-Prymnesium_polylepis.1